MQLNRLPQNYFVNQGDSDDYGEEDEVDKPIPLLIQQSSEQAKPKVTDINDILQPERFVEKYMQQIEQQEMQEHGGEQLEDDEQMQVEGMELEEGEEEEAD